MDSQVKEIDRRRIVNSDGKQGCALVLLSDNSIKCEFKNGKGHRPFLIPYETLESEANQLKNLIKHE